MSSLILFLTNTESHIDHDKLQSNEKSIEYVVPSELSEPIETSHYLSK